MTPHVAFIAAVVPTVVVVALLFLRVREMRQKSAYLLALTCGAVAAIPVALLAPVTLELMGRIETPFATALARAFLGASLPEETAKLFAMALLLMRARNSALAGSPLVVGALVGLGFATAENLVYAASEPSMIIWMRAFTAAPCHVFLGIVMASYVQWFADTRRPSLLAKAWALPVLLHALYDWPLLSEVRPLFELEAWPTPGFGAMALSGLVFALLALWSRYLARHA